MKNAKKNAFASVFISCIIFITFITITSCGGEEPKEPVDNDQNDEEVIVDNEESDDATDNEESDDIVDSEPSDDQPDELIDEENPDEDQVVTNFCEKMLDIVGDWTSINIEGYAATVTIEPREIDCRVVVKWTQGFRGTQEWYGLDLPLTLWEGEVERYMTLKRDGENLVREDTLKNGEFDNEWVFKKIQ